MIEHFQAKIHFYGVNPTKGHPTISIFAQSLIFPQNRSRHS